MAKQKTSKKRKPLNSKGKPARSPKKGARVSFRPLRDKFGRFKAKKGARVSFRPLRDKFGRFKAKKGSKGVTKKRPAQSKAAPLLRPDLPIGKQSAKAKTSKSPKAVPVLVTSNTERLITIHKALRERAIKEQRLFIPDERLRKVEDTYRKALKKSVTVTKFLTESNLESIMHQVRNAANVMGNAAKSKLGVRYVLELNLTEYGIKLYGSNKGEILKVTGIESEALHWSKWGTKASDSPEGALVNLEAGLHGFLSKKITTTLCIESVTVTALYGSTEKESG